jgi:hypothetical protein
MTQFEMGNFSLLKSMAQHASKKIDIKSDKYHAHAILIGFFKRVTAKNSQVAKKEALMDLANINTIGSDLFGILKFETWLNEKL